MKLKTFAATSLLLLSSVNTYANRVISPPPYSDMKGKRLSSLECLVTNAYMESRGESDIANLMVMATVVNRVGKRNYGDSICEVVFKDSSYSWTTDGKSDKINDLKSYRRLYKLAEEFIINKDLMIAMSQGVNHYHAVRINPYWSTAEGMEYIMTIDNHKFYKYKD